MMGTAEGAAGKPLGSAGESQQAHVGLALRIAHVPVAHQTVTQRCGHLLTMKC
jgi:hypothetical protein